MVASKFLCSWGGLNSCLSHKYWNCEHVPYTQPYLLTDTELSLRHSLLGVESGKAVGGCFPRAVPFPVLLPGWWPWWFCWVVEGFILFAFCDGFNPEPQSQHKERQSWTWREWLVRKCCWCCCSVWLLLSGPWRVNGQASSAPEERSDGYITVF